MLGGVEFGPWCAVVQPVQPVIEVGGAEFFM